MKLGATITSERGKPVTKTGNEYINISITDDNNEVIGEVVLQRSTDGLGDIIYQRTWFREGIYTWNEKKNGSLKHGIKCSRTDCNNLVETTGDECRECYEKYL